MEHLDAVASALALGYFQATPPGADMEFDLSAVLDASGNHVVSVLAVWDDIQSFNVSPRVDNKYDRYVLVQSSRMPSLIKASIERLDAQVLPRWIAHLTKWLQRAPAGAVSGSLVRGVLQMGMSALGAPNALAS